MTHTWMPDLLCAEQTIALSPEMILCVRDETNEFKKNNISEISNEKWKVDTRFFFILLLLFLSFIFCSETAALTQILLSLCVLTPLTKN